MLNFIPDFLIPLLFLIIGFLALIKGGSFLVDGAVALAEKLSLPTPFIGLTIVAFGTSAPELFTTTYAGIQGKFDMATTNVLGSNLFNICFVLGFTGLFFPLTVHKKIFNWDWAWLFSTSLLLYLFLKDLTLKPYEGILLLLSYSLFIFLSFKKQKTQKNKTDKVPVPQSSTLKKDILWVTLGFIGLILGTRWALYGGVALGTLFNLSDRFIGLVILSTGTSLPELVTSFVAAFKGHRSIVLSSVIGSNLANSLIVLGIASLFGSFYVSPQILNPDLYIVLALTLSLGLSIVSLGYKFHRPLGGAFIGAYILYFIFLVL